MDRIILEQKGTRKNGRVVVASGNVTRNRDYWSGKAIRIVPSGIRTEAWEKNPVVLWMHNFNILLGTSQVYKKNGMMYSDEGDFSFHRKRIPVVNGHFGGGIGEFDTAAIADLWEEKYINTVSIHLTLDKDDEANIVERDDEIIVPTSEMIEFSLVTVPGDRDATREKMIAMGVESHVLSYLLPEVSMATTDVEETLEEEVPVESDAQEVIFNVTEFLSILLDDDGSIQRLREALGIEGLTQSISSLEQRANENQNVRLRLVAQPRTVVEPEPVTPEPEPEPVPQVPVNGKKRSMFALMVR